MQLFCLMEQEREVGKIGFMRAGITAFGGLSRPNILNKKNPAFHAAFLFHPLSLKQAWLSFLKQKKPAHCAGFFLHLYSRRDLNPHGLMSIGF